MLSKGMKYLKGTPVCGILYKNKKRECLVGFCDSDFAGNSETRRSTAEYIFKMCEDPIIWSSKRQTGVSFSTTEAEYVASC